MIDRRSRPATGGLKSSLSLLFIFVACLIFMLPSCLTAQKVPQGYRTETGPSAALSGVKDSAGNAITGFGEFWKNLNLGSLGEAAGTILPIAGILIVLLLFFVAIRNARKKRKRR
jgi:hypothetical protein